MIVILQAILNVFLFWPLLIIGLLIEGLGAIILACGEEMTNAAEDLGIALDRLTKNEKQ